VKVAKDRKYVYKNIVHSEFHVGDHAFLSVKLNKSSLKLGSWTPSWNPYIVGHLTFLIEYG
jgi:hypothetical protein